MKTFFKQMLLLLVIAFASCKKEQEFTNNTLVGKWKLTETYDGYVMGGSFTWRKMPAGYEKNLTFYANGQFEEIEDSNGFIRKCTGTYTLQADSTLLRNSTCNTVTDRFKITEQTNTTLILDVQVIEGVIRFKYIAVQ